MKKEPLALITAIVTLINATISLAATFGLDLTADQSAALHIFTIALGGLLTVFFVRPKVTPYFDEYSNLDS